MSARQYSNKAAPATLGGGISSSDTSLSLSTVAGLPASFPYTLVIEPDSINQEIVTCTALAGTIATVTRGQDGSTATAHSAGAVVQHDISARDLQEPQDHMVATAAHGATGAVVGTTNTQTLTNKTVDLASNTVTMTKAQLNTAVSDADVASLTGSETLTNKTVALGSNTVSGTTAQFNTALSDGDFVTLAGAETVTGKTRVDATDVRSNQTTGGSSRSVAPAAQLSIADQTISNITQTTLDIDGAGLDTDSATNFATNTYAIPVAGMYEIFVQIETSDGGADYVIFLGIKKGGNYVAVNKISTGSGKAFGSFQCSLLRNFAATDALTFDIWHNKGSNLSILSTPTLGAGSIVHIRYLGPVS